jgi:hypothetical protein
MGREATTELGREMTERFCALPVGETRWTVEGSGGTVFSWDYERGRGRLLALYERGKQRQWNASTRLDWSIEVDPGSEANFADWQVPIYGSEMWDRMDAAARRELRHHMTAWLNSQFLHGEQGALICAAKIVQTVPDLDSKFYAATQVVDEARHVEAYSRYLREKVGMAYPINPHLRALLQDVVADSRWDMTNLGMQVLIEGLALAAFSMVRDHSAEPLARAINAFVMQDEARHVAFGRLALRDHYPQLTTAERAEREEFVVEASYLMRDRLVSREVWENLGLPVEECAAHVERSEMMRHFRRRLFSRIVPTVRDIGLWGERVRRAFQDMGVLEFQDLDLDRLAAEDDAVARRLDPSLSLSEEAAAAAELARVDPARALEVEQTIRDGVEG